MENKSTGGIQHSLNKPGSSLRKYQGAVTGSESWLFLVLYEFIECCITPVPGKIGKILRSNFYPLILASCSRKVDIGKNISLTQPKKILFSSGVTVEDSVILNVKGTGDGIHLHKNVRLGKKSILSCPGGKIIIGEGTVIEEECRIGSLEGLTIGKSCHIGRQTYVIGAAHAYDRLDVPIIHQPLTCRGETIIGENVRVGSGVTLRDGVRIGNGAQIEDGALVLEDIEASSVVRGVPALPVAGLKKW